MKRRSFIGKRFGYLTVTAQSPYARHWKCRCDCGKSINLAATDLKPWSSCGCKTKSYDPETYQDVVSFDRDAMTVSIPCQRYEYLRQCEVELRKLEARVKTSIMSALAEPPKT